jgi:hypothetical protein
MLGLAIVFAALCLAKTPAIPTELHSALQPQVKELFQ